MLFIELFAPKGILSADQRRDLSRRLVTEVLSAPDAPKEMLDAIERGRALAQAVVHEPDAWSAGGHDVDQAEGPRFVVRVSLPARHLSDGMRAELVARITRALAEVDDDPGRPYREPRVWVHIAEVPDGNMGSFGRVLCLSDMLKMVVSGGNEPVQAAVPAGEPAPDTAVDPVCGMRVALTVTTVTLERDGDTYAFCCGGCRDAFAARHAAAPA